MKVDDKLISELARLAKLNFDEQQAKAAFFAKQQQYMPAHQAFSGGPMPPPHNWQSAPGEYAHA